MNGKKSMVKTTGIALFVSISMLMTWQCGAVGPSGTNSTNTDTTNTDTTTSTKGTVNLILKKAG